MHLTTRLIVLAGALLLCGGGAAQAARTWVPPDDTITALSGASDRGFHIRYFDGSETWTPTLSEAVAECGEYHRRLETIRCRTAVRTWYRGLGDTKRAIRYARTR